MEEEDTVCAHLDDHKDDGPDVVEPILGQTKCLKLHFFNNPNQGNMWEIEVPTIK